MRNCREMAQLCSMELERSLSIRETVSMRLHLALCTGCRNFRTHIFTLREAAQAYARGEAPELDDAMPQRRI